MLVQSPHTRLIVIVSVLLLGTMYQVNTTTYTVLISSIASEMVDVRQDMSTDQVGWLISLPGLFMIPGVLLSPLLLRRIRMRSLMIGAWALFGLSGAGVFFCTTTAGILSCRALTGLAIGLCQPSTRALPARMYDDKWRPKVMGWIAMAGGIVTVIMALLAGYLALVNWRVVMLLYLIVALLFIALALLFVPNLPQENPTRAKEQEQSHQSKQTGIKKQSFGRDTWMMIAAAFVVYVVGSVVQVKSSMLVVERGLGGTDVVGYVSIFRCAGIIVGGACFGSAYRLCGRWLFPASLGIAGLTYFWFAHSCDVVSLCISAAITGAFSIGIAMVYYVTRVTYTTPAHRTTMALTLVTLSTYLGQVFTTPFINGAEALWGTSAAVSLDAVGIVFMAVMVVGIIYILATRTEQGSHKKTS